MASACDSLIASAIIPDCANAVAGFEQEGVIINRCDIDYSGIVYNATHGNVITTLPLKDGKKGYKVKQLKNPFNDTETTLEAGTYKNTFTNSLHLCLFDNGPVTADQASTLANGDFVVILRQKQKNNVSPSIAAGESIFRIYGLKNGLQASEGTNNPNDEDLGNGWSFTLEETGVSDAALFLFNTDLSTTEAQVEAYL